MNGNDYKELAMRTNDGLSELRLIRELAGTQSPCHAALKGNAGTLLNGVLGLTGEAGEVADLVKKGIFHEKGIDPDSLKKELGDVLWYIALICEACGFDLDEIMTVNVLKLQCRYPDGFDTDRANHREKGDI